MAIGQGIMNIAATDTASASLTTDGDFARLCAIYLSLDQRERIYFSDYLSESNKVALEKDLASAGRLKFHLLHKRFSNWQKERKAKNEKKKRRNYWPYVLALIIVRALWKQSWGAALFFVAILVAYLYSTHTKNKGEQTIEAVKNYHRPKAHEIQELKARVGIGGYTQTMFAIQSWDAKALIDSITLVPAQIDQPDSKGYMPLIFALNSNFIDGIKILLGNGADFNFDERNSEESAGKAIVKFIKSEEALLLLLCAFDKCQIGSKLSPT
jgi:hypothetical protein